MGPTTAVSTDQLVSMIDRSATATYTLTSNSAGVREDTLILAMTFQVTDGAWRDHLHRQLHGHGRDRSLRCGNGRRRCCGIGAPHRANNSGIGSFSLSGGITFGPGD